MRPQGAAFQTWYLGQAAGWQACWAAHQIGSIEPWILLFLISQAHCALALGLSRTWLQWFGCFPAPGGGIVPASPDLRCRQTCWPGLGLASLPLPFVPFPGGSAPLGCSSGLLCLFGRGLGPWQSQGSSHGPPRGQPWPPSPPRQPSQAAPSQVAKRKNGCGTRSGHWGGAHGGARAPRPPLPRRKLKFTRRRTRSRHTPPPRLPHLPSQTATPRPALWAHKPGHASTS